MPLAERVDDVVDVVVVLRDDDRIGTTCDSGIGGDPPFGAAHDLNDDDPVVRLCRGRESIDRFGSDADRSVESECHVGSADVVVDGLRDADNRQTLFGQLQRRPQRPVAPDDDEAIDPVGVDGSLARCIPVAMDVGVHA